MKGRSSVVATPCDIVHRTRITVESRSPSKPLPASWSFPSHACPPYYSRHALPGSLKPPRRALVPRRKAMQRLIFYFSMILSAAARYKGTFKCSWIADEGVKRDWRDGRKSQLMLPQSSSMRAFCQTLHMPDCGWLLGLTSASISEVIYEDEIGNPTSTRGGQTARNSCMCSNYQLSLD